MSHIKQGSRVVMVDSSKQGTVIHLDNQFALVLTDDDMLWIPVEKIKEMPILNNFVQGNFSDSKNFLLSMDAYRLTNAYSYDPYVLASSMKIDIFPHQIDEISKILENPRMLIADEVGLGKTIVAGLVISELYARGMSNRILFVVPKSLVGKWMSELENKFDLKVEEITSANFREFLEPKNKSLRGDFSITSLDFLRQPQIVAELKNTNVNWDIIVFDEAHKLVKTDKFETQRYSVAKVLSSKCKYLLLLTATPHDGNRQTFNNRVHLLEPGYNEDTLLSHIMIRNKKEDVISLNGKEVFPKRISKTIRLDRTQTSRAEKELYDSLDDYLVSIYEDARSRGKQKGIKLVSTILRKRSSSSVYALRRTLTSRLENLSSAISYEEDDISEYYQRKREGDLEDEEEDGLYKRVLSFSASPLEKELAYLHDLIDLAKGIEDNDTKLEELSKWIRIIKERNADAKVLIFTEYRDTLAKIKSSLLDQGYLAVSIDGTMSMTEREEALKKFTKESDIMIATDAAGEGLDMQFATNIEINYDLPWNPNRLEQRMGRIHRIGQIKDVYYYNIINSSTIDGQILSKVMEKVEEISLVMGDKVYDVIGQIINEDEITQLYEELLDVPRAEWTPRIIKRVEEIVENKKQTKKQIDHLLIGHRFDKSKLADYETRIQSSIITEDVKRFVFEFIKEHQGTINLVDKNKDLFRIIIPQTLNTLMKRYGGKMVLQGTFYQSEYDYLALGNKTVMAMLKSMLRPAYSIITHPTLGGVLFVYKLSAFDGRYQQRHGSIVGIVFDGKKSDILDLSELWDFGAKINVKQYSVDLNLIEEGLIHATSKIKTMTSNFRNEVDASIGPQIDRIRQTTTSYYSDQNSKLESAIRNMEQMKNESPSTSRKYSDLLYEQEVFGKRYAEALRKVEKDMQIEIVTELIGISLIVPPISDMQKVSDHERTMRPYFVPKRSDFTKLNSKMNTELSTTTHERLKKDPNEWFEYHRLFEEDSRDWKVKPVDEIIVRLRGFPRWWKIGDFGCGKAKIRDMLGDRVYSFDHIAINDNVTSCDMKNTGLPDGSLEVIIFCLSLMNSNWEEYIREARRCLVVNGTLLIAETTHSLEARLSDLRDILRRYSFQIYLEYEQDRFLFIEATKRDFKTIYT